MDIHLPSIVPTPERVAELDRLGNEIAELSAHVEAATARLLALIREFDARGGWNGGSRSCAEWLSWRAGLDLGAPRERLRMARALGTLPRLAGALACGELSYAKVRALSIACATGRMEARPRSATSPCSVAGTTAPFTKRAIRSSASPMGRSCSGGRTAGPCPTSRSRPRCPPIRSRPCARTTRRKGFASTRGQHARPG